MSIASWPLCVVVHKGRFLTKVAPSRSTVTLWGVWVSDDTHPLGGTAKDVVLTRRVNLTKDAARGWSGRPLYEFVPKENTP